VFADVERGERPAVRDLANFNTSDPTGLKAVCNNGACGEINTTARKVLSAERHP